DDENPLNVSNNTFDLSAAQSESAPYHPTNTYSATIRHSLQDLDLFRFSVVQPESATYRSSDNDPAALAVHLQDLETTTLPNSLPQVGNSSSLLPLLLPNLDGRIHYPFDPNTPSINITDREPYHTSRFDFDTIFESTEGSTSCGIQSIPKPQHKNMDWCHGQSTSPLYPDMTPSQPSISLDYSFNSSSDPTPKSTSTPRVTQIEIKSTTSSSISEPKPSPKAMPRAKRLVCPACPRTFLTLSQLK
ncbi:MAG: hypothetical protein M1814_004340, partial [Vezdaea aestivalis]